MTYRPHEHALFNTRKVAEEVARKVAKHYGCTRLECRSFSVEKRGERLGYMAYYASGPKFYPVFEDQVEEVQQYG
jgi:hypothetical protein